jgi:predicted RNA binding protein with dsRBD fold (UPF0201 family)
MSLPGFFKSLGKYIARLFSQVHSIDPDKAAQVINNIAQGAVIALPYVQLVTAVTPTGIDDKIVEAISKLLRPEVVDEFQRLAKEAITTLQTAEKNIRQETKRSLATKLLKTGLTLTINDALAKGGKGINFAGITISTAEQVAGLQTQTINQVLEMALALKTKASKD